MQNSYFAGTIFTTLCMRRTVKNRNLDLKTVKEIKNGLSSRGTKAIFGIKKIGDNIHLKMFTV